ncbi:MAG: hypothetical protein JWO38_204 [Gemmataceae bacterium]|nr:hypothetical protein [Gemmataceae bacterium]
MTPPTHPPETLPDRVSVRVDRYQIVVRPAAPQAGRKTFSYPVAAAAVILGWSALNLAYLAFACPLDLAPDEAHYWHWSRHLDWSYYSKGPLIAWLIRGSCELFGDLSGRLVGSEMLAVRLPAVLSGGLLLAGLYTLAVEILRCPRTALAVVVLALTLPPVTAAAVVMTIDPPFLAFWAWGLVFVWKGVRPGSDPTPLPRTVGSGSGRGCWWTAAGLCSAFGVLAKYPMLLFPLAVMGFVVCTRRGELRRPGFWVFLGLTALGCVPIVLWNAGHDLVSIRHALGQAGIGDGVKERPFRWLGPLGFAAGQVGVLLGFWFVAFAAAGWAYRHHSGCLSFRRGREALGPCSRTESQGKKAGPCDVGLSLLWWASVPVWGVFFVASSRNAGQVNWPAAAYVGGVLLAVAWVRDQLAHPVRLRRRLVGLGLIVAVVLGLGFSVALRYPGLTRPALAQLVGPPTEMNPAPVRKLDPTCRLRGWRTLAAEVDQIRDRVECETGRDPVLAGMLWTTPGELSFYCRGHPEAYSFGLVLGDRHSQYDLWRPNPAADAQVFRGRSFVYIGDEIPAAGDAFDRVEPPVKVVHSEDGVPVAVWTVWVGHGFRGFSGPSRRPGRPSY